MPNYVIIAKALQHGNTSGTQTIEELVFAATSNEAIQVFWANTAEILARHQLRVDTTSLSLSIVEVLDPGSPSA